MCLASAALSWPMSSRAEHSQLSQLEGEKRNARLAEVISAHGYQRPTVTLSQLNWPNDPHRWDVRCSNAIEYAVHFNDQPKVPPQVPPVIVEPCAIIDAAFLTRDFARKCFPNREGGQHGN